jgi:hypothetical protein
MHRSGASRGADPRTRLISLGSESKTDLGAMTEIEREIIGVIGHWI